MRRRPINIDDGIALAPSAQGYWPDDGWLGEKSTLPILFYQAVRAVRLEFWLPPGSRERHAEIVLNSWTTQVMIPPDQLVKVDVPVSGGGGGVTIHVTIDGDPAPKPDVRVLGAILAGIRRI
jgi:hypothetical protein